MTDIVFIVIGVILIGVLAVAAGLQLALDRAMARVEAESAALRLQPRGSAEVERCGICGRELYPPPGERSA